MRHERIQRLDQAEELHGVSSEKTAGISEVAFDLAGD
jgi:hypothetical protein